MSENTLEDSFEKVSISEKDGDKSENQNSKGSCNKREDYLPWEDYFLAVAFLSAMRSKDPSTQVIFDREKLLWIHSLNKLGISKQVPQWRK